MQGAHLQQEKKVQILLSTYNGEKYLQEQLDSFLHQDNFEQIKVLIRDDGSTDNTIKILEQYHKKYGFEIVYGKNIGVNESYRTLFSMSDKNCKYFALSDQDDVWVCDKINCAVQSLETMDSTKPALFSSISCVTNEKLEPIGFTLQPKKGVSFYNAMVQNVLPGHTQVFNRALMESLLENGIKDVSVIDWWIYLVASGIGEIVFDENYTVLHRQHGKNSVGYEMNFFKKCCFRIKRVFQGQANAISIQLKSFYEKYSLQLPKAYQEELQRYLFFQKSFIDRIKYVCSAKVYRQTSMETLLFKALYLLGKYRV